MTYTFIVGVTPKLGQGPREVREDIEGVLSDHLKDCWFEIQWAPGSPESVRAERCPHRRLNEDGICRACGADRRGSV